MLTWPLLQQIPNLGPPAVDLDNPLAAQCSALHEGHRMFMWPKLWYAAGSTYGHWPIESDRHWAMCWIKCSWWRRTIEQSYERETLGVSKLHGENEDQGEFHCLVGLPWPLKLLLLGDEQIGIGGNYEYNLSMILLIIWEKTNLVC